MSSEFKRQIFKVVVAISGASGFLGRVLVEELSKKYTIHALSRKQVQSRKKVVWFQGDICKSIPKNFLCKGCLVIHCAGTFKGDCHKVNVLGTTNLLNNAIQAKVKKIIYISSCAVYDFTTRKKIITINSKKNLKSKYSASKNLAEVIVQEKAKKANIPFIILRPASIISKTKINILVKIQKLISQKNYLLPFPAPCYFFVTEANQIVESILNHKKIKDNTILNICKSQSWISKTARKIRTTLLMKALIKIATFLRNKAFQSSIFLKYPLLASSFSSSLIYSHSKRDLKRSSGSNE